MTQNRCDVDKLEQKTIIGSLMLRLLCMYALLNPINVLQSGFFLDCCCCAVDASDQIITVIGLLPVTGLFGHVNGLGVVN